MKNSPGPRLRRYTTVTSILVMALFVVAGCASTPTAPPDSLTAAKDAIASAEQADARQYAGAELDEANQKLAQAESAIASEQIPEGEQFSKQSRVAAELAMARTAEAKAQEINRQMGRDAGALDEEMNRMGDQR